MNVTQKKLLVFLKLSHLEDRKIQLIIDLLNLTMTTYQKESSKIIRECETISFDRNNLSYISKFIDFLESVCIKNNESII